MSADVAAGATTSRAAVRFFWLWLIAAAGVSVAGNVAHAVLSATVRLAAAAAVVPPAVLLGSTHSVALLVKTRRVGFIYWGVLAMTIVLAGCAFVLSFDALRDLAVSLGMRPRRAWLWPVAIDVSIANSTLSLLSLSAPGGAPGAAGRSNVAAQQISASTASPQPVRESASAVGSASASHPGGAVMGPACRQPGQAAPRQAERVPDSLEESQRTLAVVPAAQRANVLAPQHFRPAADELVRSGVTSKDPAIVAAVLAAHAAGTPPSTIGRLYKMHHSTVGRILAAAHELTA